MSQILRTIAEFFAFKEEPKGEITVDTIKETSWSLIMERNRNVIIAGAVLILGLIILAFVYRRGKAKTPRKLDKIDTECGRRSAYITSSR